MMQLGSRTYKILILGFLSVLAIVGVTFTLNYQIFKESSAEINLTGQMQAARIVDQALSTYFQSLKITTENAVLNKSFSPEKTKKEDDIRFATWPVSAVKKAIQEEGIITLLTDRASSSTNDLKVTKPLEVWQLFKSLPPYDIDGKPVAADRRHIGRNILKAFPDIHYVFEMDINGDLTFLEPYNIQKNITSFNFSFRDYIALVKKSRRTSLSEGYISHDQNRTQIITMATPIFDETNQIKKLFAASISAATLRDRVFYSIKSNMDVNDGTTFYLVDRHGHVVASSSGENTYFPEDGNTTDEEDIGNIRNLDVFKDVRWENDILEKGNMWERTTKSWVVSTLGHDKSVRYNNHAGVDVFGTFYPTSILPGDDKKWGILVETPVEQVFYRQSRLRNLLLVASFIILLVLAIIAVYVVRMLGGYEQRLNQRSLDIQEMTRQVAHDVQSPITALNILGQTLSEANGEQKRLLTSTIKRLREITENLRSHGVLKVNSMSDNFSHFAIRQTVTSKLLIDIVNEKRIEFSDKFPGSTLTLNVPEDLNTTLSITNTELFRVLSNLLNNAAEASQGIKESAIHIEVSKSQNGILVAVQDSGCGIDPNHIELVKQRGTSFGKTNGTGQGLSYAVETIERARGSLTIDSEPGQGTTVKFFIPTKSPAAEAQNFIST